MRRARALSYALMAFMGFGSGACTYRRLPFPGTLPTGPLEEPAPGVKVLSARATTPDVGEGRDAIVVVFSHPLDPASVQATDFLLITEGGARGFPERVRLAPADEADENRSVWLTGTFGDAEDAVRAVKVIDLAFTRSGEVLRGLDATVDPVDTPLRLVHAERASAEPHRCGGAAQAVRTYWSDALRGLQEDDLKHFRLRMADGSTRTPVAFDDHAGLQDAEGAAAAWDDNVVDLCVDVAMGVARVQVSPDTVEDARGLRNRETSTVVVVSARQPDASVP